MDPFLTKQFKTISYGIINKMRKKADPIKSKRLYISYFITIIFLNGTTKNFANIVGMNLVLHF